MVVGRGIVRRRLIKRHGTRCPAGDWDNHREGALRPKMCKLACHPRLACAVSAKLRRKWSPEQVAGWLKRAFPGEAHKQVSHALTGRVLRSNVPRGERSTEVFIYRREASLKRNSWSICAQDGLSGVPSTQVRSAREMARLRMLCPSAKDLHQSRIVPCQGTGKAT